MSRLPPILAFAAPSGTGKTTLIESVVRVLVGRGLRVGVLKSDAHRVVLDRPGKDSWRFAEAGARQVVVLSAERLALFERPEGDQSLVHVIDRLLPDAEIVLAEGFRQSGLPSVRVHRVGGPDDEGWAPPRHLLAWVSDGRPVTKLPVLPLGDPEAVADWIQARFVRPPRPRRPTVVCATRGQEQVRAALAATTRIAELLGAPAMLVADPALRVPESARVRLVHDLRPQLALLGALFTGLAAADTPEILFLGPRHFEAPDALLTGLLEAGSPRSDIVYPRVDGRPEPACAVYGHRCLSSIQSSLLSGELRLTGWWGQVCATPVEELVWRRWDPEARAFPR